MSSIIFIKFDWIQCIFVSILRMFASVRLNKTPLKVERDVEVIFYKKKGLAVI